MHQPTHTPCRGNPDHNLSATYICLDSVCAKKRLLCNECLRDTRHQGHKIALICSMVDPFSRLSANSHLPNARNLHTALLKKARSIEKTIIQTEQQFQEVLDQVRARVLVPLLTITGTYSPKTVNETKLIIEKSTTQTQEIEDIA